DWPAARGSPAPSCHTRLHLPATRSGHRPGPPRATSRKAGVRFRRTRPVGTTMTQPLTDQRLRTLQRFGAARAASDPQILAMLRAHPDKFMVMLPASSRGATCWTLADRRAAAMFSERDHELKSLVWAVGLKTLEQNPDAGKQTQFIVADELARYAYEMLERS